MGHPTDAPVELRLLASRGASGRGNFHVITGENASSYIRWPASVRQVLLTGVRYDGPRYTD